MRRALPVFVIGLAAAPALWAAAAAQGDLEGYECVARVDGAGREEPAPDSPLLRWDDGRPRILEKGATGYGHVTKDVRLPAWIELYGAQSARANSLLGYFRTGNFDCKPFGG